MKLGSRGLWLVPCLDRVMAWAGHCRLFPEGGRCIIYSLCPPKTICVLKSHTLCEVTLFVQNTVDLKE
jgi:hypothetical protein